MIRRATIDDLQTCLDYGERFHAISPHVWIPYDRDAASSFLTSLIANGAVFLSEEGMIGGLVYPLYFNPAFEVAAEMFWWAPKGGSELRQAFERWARESGAVAVSFSALANDRSAAMERLFGRAGFAATETSYLKRL